VLCTPQSLGFIRRLFSIENSITFKKHILNTTVLPVTKKTQALYRCEVFPLKCSSPSDDYKSIVAFDNLILILLKHECDLKNQNVI
jgi:hypothetical protein